MGHKDMDWTAIDRAHEAAELAQEGFDTAVAAAAREHAKAIRTNALLGHQQTLETLAEDLANRLSLSGVTEQLIRASIVGGPLVAGHLLIDLIQKGIDFEAEVQGTKEVERAERVAA
jgi:hypothetical protein